MVREKLSTKIITSARIEWIDTFKGIMIALVVIGHATGQFNGWIYQFHMAAFFFASGYLSNVENKSSISVAVKKIFTILLPFLTLSIAGIIINEIITRFGSYEFLFGSSFVGVKRALSELFLHGVLHIQYWGTFWFLTTLLGIEYLHLFLFQLNGKRLNAIYFMACISLFFLGYWMVLNSVVPKLWIFDLDLIFIGQGYFNAGLFFRKIKIGDYMDNATAKITVFIITIFIAIWGKANGMTVDYPSRSFSYPFWEFVVALASIYIIYLISTFISDYTKRLKALLALLGKNSLGIMAFHFIFFKLFMVALYITGYATSEQITNVVLPTELKTVRFWLPMAIIATVGSLIVWLVVTRIPGIKFILGQDSKANTIICRKAETNRYVIVFAKSFRAMVIKFWNIVNTLFRENKLLVGVFSLLIVLYAIPMYRTGIILNDELQARCLAMQGLTTFYKTEFMAWIRQGRLLAAPINSFTKWLSFIGVDVGTSFRVGSIIILLGVVSSFGIFINKVFNKKWFAIFTATFALTCMPIAFEHAPPNAFVGFIAFSFMLVLISNSIYADYLETNQKKYAAISMCLFFIAMMSYEAFITYTVLYLLVVFGKKGFKNIKNDIKYYLIPIGTAITFLICYLICSRLTPSGYDGNQLGFDSITEPLKIVLNLFFVCIPGFFVFFPRYSYFKQLYFNLTAVDYIRIAIFVACFAFISVVVIKKMIDADNERLAGEKSSPNVGKHVFVILCGLSYMILPSLPNSIAYMYQGIVGFNGNFLTLPVTFLEYFAAVFVVCYVTWLIIKSAGGKFYLIIIAMMCLLVVNIQEMNDVFSKEQNKNFNRLVEIESFLKTDTVKKLPTGKYFAADLYERQNLLAIHNGYWSTYCNNVMGMNIKLSAEHDSAEIGNIYYDGDNFVIVSARSITILSRDQEKMSKAIRIEDDNYEVLDFKKTSTTLVEDHGYYVYTIPYDGASFSRVGYLPISGHYADGWLESTSEFSITTGENGLLSGKLYCPIGTCADKKIDVYWNNTLIQTIEINKELTAFNITLDSNDTGTLKFKCNFECEEKDPSDIRPIAILLMEMIIE